MDEREFEDALMRLIDKALEGNVDTDAVISALQLRIMALEEEQ
ncbi:MAG: hypothetical protein ACK5SX_15150 [Sandaracinobacter sp.]